MDVEKTIQFLIENAAQHDARIAAAERNIVILGDSLITLTSMVKRLVESQEEFKRHTQAAADEMRKEMRERDAQSRERDAALDERISKLVSAIAALEIGRAHV
jgi:hypothetical protein